MQTPEVAAKDAGPRVARRRVYYLAGFDTRGPGFYHQLYRDGAAQQERINGCSYQVGALEPGPAHSSHFSIRSDGPDGRVDTTYTFLQWNDIIRAHWPTSTLRVAASIPAFYDHYVRHGCLARTRALSKPFYWMIMLPLLYTLVGAGIAALAGLGLGLLAHRPAMAADAGAAGRYPGPVGAPARVLADAGMDLHAGVGAPARAHGGALVRLCPADRHGTRVEPGGRGADRRPQRRRHGRDFAGQPLAGSRAIGRFPPGPCETDDHRTPLLGLIPEAGWFRRQIAQVGGSTMPMEYTAPADPLCYALVDPFTACGLPPVGRPGYRIKSARFDRMFDAGKVQADPARLLQDPFPVPGGHRPPGRQRLLQPHRWTATAGGLRPGKPAMTRLPPKPPARGRAALLGGLFSRDGRSMLNLLTERAYTVQMGVTQVARKRLFMVNAPETVREVLGERVAEFPKHDYIADILKPLIGISLFNANGETWARQRRLVDQSFAKAGLRHAFPLMCEAIDELILRCDEVADGRVWLADEAMSGTTADIIFRTILSTRLAPSLALQVHDAFRSYQENAQRVMGLSALHLPTWWHHRRCRQQGQAIRASFAGIIHARFAAVARADRPARRHAQRADGCARPRDGHRPGDAGLQIRWPRSSWPAMKPRPRPWPGPCTCWPAARICRPPCEWR